VNVTRPFTSAEIEAGRKLFAGDWQFAAAAGSLEALPVMRGIEIAVAGRSNVGKSSLINALTGRRALARISHTPGRTQELIFFSGPSRLTLVDMPGYGYAAAAKTKIKAWTELIHAFLFGRTNLARVYLLVDARHGLKPTDAEVLARIGAAQRAVEEQLDHVHLRAGLREALNLARFGNEWFDRQAPWKQVREDRAAAGRTMGSLLDLINAAKVLFAPFLPHTSAALHALLGYADELESRGWHFDAVPGGQRLPAPRPLFRKLEVTAEEAA